MEAKVKRKGLPWYWLPFYDTSKEINKFLQYWGFAGTLIGFLFFVVIRDETWAREGQGGLLCFFSIILGFWFLAIYFFVGSILSKYRFQQAKIKSNEVA
jgi:hypothetical protein